MNFLLYSPLALIVIAYGVTYFFSFKNRKQRHEKEDLIIKKSIAEFKRVRAEKTKSPTFFQPEQKAFDIKTPESSRDKEDEKAILYQNFYMDYELVKNYEKHLKEFISIQVEPARMAHVSATGKTSSHSHRKVHRLVRYTSPALRPRMQRVQRSAKATTFYHTTQGKGEPGKLVVDWRPQQYTEAPDEIKPVVKPQS